MLKGQPVTTNEPQFLAKPQSVILVGPAGGDGHIIYPTAHAAPKANAALLPKEPGQGMQNGTL